MLQESRLPVQRGIQVWSRLLISQAEVIVARGVLLVTVVRTRFRCCLGNRVRPKRVGNLKAVAEVEDLQKVPGPQKVLKVANQAEVTGPAAAKEAVKALNLAEAKAVTPCRNTHFTSRIAKV